MLNKFLDFIGSRSPFMWLGIGFLVLIQTVQFVILISYFLSFFPVFSHVDFAASAAPTIYLSRDSQIYRLGVLFYNAMFFLIAVMGFKNTQKKRYAPIYWAILVEILVLVVLFAGLNLRFTGDHVLARPNALLGIGIFLTFASCRTTKAACK